MKEAQQPINPRQALIKAAISGWAGDDPCPWHCPATAETIIAWAKSHTKNREDTFERDFEDLVAEGLFFEIQHGVFDPAVYYCSYEPDFLDEIHAVSDLKTAWKDMQLRYDEEQGCSTWRNLGLCAGQGSQGPSGSRWGPCLGISCCSFEDGSPSCTHDLAFAKAQHVRCQGCGQSVQRESLQPHRQPLLDKEGRGFTHPKVCPRCSTDRSSLIRVARCWRRWVDLDRTLNAFDKSTPHAV